MGDDTICTLSTPTLFARSDNHGWEIRILNETDFHACALSASQHIRSFTHTGILPGSMLERKLLRIWMKIEVGMLYFKTPFATPTAMKVDSTMGNE